MVSNEWFIVYASNFCQGLGRNIFYPREHALKNVDE